MNKLFSVLTAINKKNSSDICYLNVQTFPSSGHIHFQIQEGDNFRFGFSRGETKKTCSISFLPVEGTDVYGNQLAKVEEILFLAFGQHDEVFKNQHGEPVFVWWK